MTAVPPQPNIKAIIWDLDDTLWQGTLAEGDALSAHPELIALIPALDRAGIIQSVSSKNDAADAQQELHRLDIARFFVFSRIDFLPKGQNIRAIIADLQLRAENVLFVDDHPGNREEAVYYNAGLQVADPASPTLVARLQTLADAAGEENRSRLDFYRVLETKQQAREHFNDNTAFLNDSHIAINLLRNPGDLTYLDRITELANRSNQLNFTRSRFPDADSISRYFDGPDSMHRHHGAVFVHDRFGHYGLVGFYAFDERQSHRSLEHFYFSCRTLNMGIEQAVYQHLRERYAIQPFAPLEEHAALRHDFSLQEGMDAATRDYLAQTLEEDQHYETAIIAGCSSGMIAHYLSPAMRPTRFLNHHLSQPELEANNFRHLIYALYSDYITKGWSTKKWFSYRRFRDQLTRLAERHKDTQITLLLASEKYPMPYKPWPKRLEDAVLHGRSMTRVKRCNAIARRISARFAHVKTVEMGDYVEHNDEQIDPRHFVRVVFQRMAQNLGEAQR